MSEIYSTYSLDQLVEACRQVGTAEVWSEFVARTRNLVTGAVVAAMRRWKVCRSLPPEDVVQDVYLKISANHAAVLRSFQAQHSHAAAGYLRAIAANLAHDFCKGRNADRRGAGREESLDESRPPAGAVSSGEQEIERVLLIREIDGILLSGGPDSARDRNIFWLYYRQGFTAKAIAAIPAFGLTVKGVESALFRMTQIVREQLGQGDEGKGNLRRKSS